MARDLSEINSRGMSKRFDVDYCEDCVEEKESEDNLQRLR